MDVFSGVKNIAQKTQNFDSIKQTQNKQIEMPKIEQTEKTDKHSTNITAGEKEKLKKELQKITDELNKALNPLNTSLKFKFNNKIDQLTVEVVDTKKDEVIRQFPSQEALKLMEKMKEIVGILFDKKG